MKKTRAETYLQSTIKVFLIFSMAVFMVNLISSATTLGTFKQGECIELLQTCSNCTYNNISRVFYPNSSIALSNAQMSKDGTFYNYTFCDTSTLGTYLVNGLGNLDGEVTSWVYDFEISPTGFSVNSTQGLVTFGFIISLIAIVFIFVFLSFRFMDSDKLFPIALFFLLVALILVIYILHLGYIFSRDVLFPLALEGVQTKIYIGIMYSLVGISFLALLLLMLKALKEIKERKNIQRYGEGWNPQTRQYE